MSAPRHAARIAALALMLAGLAAASTIPSLARGLGGGGFGGGPSISSMNIGPRMNSGISNPGGNQNATPASAKKGKGKKGKKPKEEPPLPFMTITIDTTLITGVQ